MRATAVFLGVILLNALSWAAETPQAVLTSQEAPRLTGIWKSEAPRSLAPGVFYTQEIQFTLSRWERTLVFANNADMKKIFLISRSEGPFELKKGADEKAPWLLNLKVSRRALNLMQKQSSGLKALGASGCPLVHKREVEIPNGCGIFPGVEKCPVEYQIAETKDGKLRLGNPPEGAANTFNGFCDEQKRPALLDLSLKRIN